MMEVRELVDKLCPCLGLWKNDIERFRLKDKLNKDGFYVIHEANGKRLAVYAIRKPNWFERWFK